MRFLSWFLTLLPLLIVVPVVLLVVRSTRNRPAKGIAGYDVAHGSGVW